MKAVPFAFRAVLLGLFSSPLHAQGPVLSTPGTATWSTEITAGGGTRTIFTITDNTVLDWNQLNLGTDSELVFDFIGGDSVVNNLTGTKTHKLDGDVTSNGFVGFFSPNAHLRIDGNITAKGVTIANLIDPTNELFACVVDLNPGKQGHFLAGTGHPIVGPHALQVSGVCQVREGLQGVDKRPAVDLGEELDRARVPLPALGVLVCVQVDRLDEHLRHARQVGLQEGFYS